jgi:hypothetical protein
MLACRINSRWTPIGASIWSNHERKLCLNVFQPTRDVIQAPFAAGRMSFFLNLLLMVRLQMALKVPPSQTCGCHRRNRGRSPVVPAIAKVLFGRPGEPPLRVDPRNPISLSKGTWAFTAQASGYQTSTVFVTVADGEQ